jgi:hypothetical protein
MPFLNSTRSSWHQIINAMIKRAFVMKKKESSSFLKKRTKKLLSIRLSALGI